METRRLNHSVSPAPAPGGLAPVAIPGKRPGAGRSDWYDGPAWDAVCARAGLPAGSRPPLPFRDPAPIAGDLDSILGQFVSPEVALADSLAREWPDIVGAAVAAHTRPGAVERGILTVYVKGSVWFAQLRHIGAAAILRNIAARHPAPALRAVTFKPV